MTTATSAKVKNLETLKFARLVKKQAAAIEATLDQQIKEAGSMRSILTGTDSHHIFVPEAAASEKAIQLLISRYNSAGWGVVRHFNASKGGTDLTLY